MSTINEDALRRSRFDLNDLGNAKRLAEHVAGKLVWIEEQEAWCAFDGTRWSMTEGKTYARAYSHDVQRGLTDEFFALSKATDAQLSAVYGAGFSDEMRKKRALELYAWAQKTGDIARCRAMLEQAKGLRGDNSGEFLLCGDLTDFDTDKLAYHCANGTLRFGQGSDGVWRHRFEPGHRAEDRFMQISKLVYDADARPTGWLEQFATMFADPVQTVAIQRIYGMTLTGLTSDQSFYVFQGKGQDGKSLINSVIGGLHGDYFRSTSPKTFLEGPTQNGSAHQSDIVRLSGDIRLVVFDEPKKNSTWDGERIKQVTGSKITARGAHEKSEITYVPRWKLIGEVNGLPKAPSDDRGFRRRFRLYPFTVQFGITPGTVDKPFHIVQAQLISEGSGILNWMIKGALDWLTTNEIPEPELAKRATASFWTNASALAEWIESECDISDPEARTGATLLYKAFRQWCIDRGDKEDKIISQTSFGLRLNDAQIYAVPNAQRTKDRVGIRVRGIGEARAPAADRAPTSAVPAPADYDDEWPL